MADPDVFKILKDLELKAVGLDPASQKMQEGYFVAFRSVGLPLPEADFKNPFNPALANLDKNVKTTPSQDPAKSVDPHSPSAQLGPDRATVAAVADMFRTYLNTFELTDDKLVMNSGYSVMPNATKVSDTWWAIINGATANPNEPQVSPAVQKQLDAAKAVLADADGNPTPEYKAYKNYEKAYNDAFLALRRGYANAFTDPIKLANYAAADGVVLQNAVDSALADWEGLGNKAKIEDAQATLAAQGLDPSTALIARAKASWANSLYNIPGLGNVPYVTMIPPSWYDSTSDQGWTQYTQTDLSTNNKYTASSTAFGGGAGLAVGLWRADAQFNNAHNQSSMNIDTSDLQISFSYCVIDVARLGVDTSLLNLQNWFLMGPDYKKGCISNGTMGQERPNTGEPAFLPSLVTSVILIRDLQLTFAKSTDAQTAINGTIGANACVGYGPFAVSGGYSHKQQNQTLSSQLDGQSLKINGIQLVGYVSAITPLSPGLNSADFVKAAAFSGSAARLKE